jgi:hypothetical protein
MQYTLFDNGENQNLVVVHEGEMFSATDQHPNWTKIREGLERKDPAIVKLFDVARTASEVFKRLSDRVTILGGSIHFDNQPVGGDLAEQILRFIDEGVEDWQPLVNFYEKLMTNLEPHTREQLFRWLTQQQITITPEGDFIAYKGVTAYDEGGEAKYRSISSGEAIVDGKVYKGYIPNWIGAVVEMPRDKVQHDPSVGCHTGLHAGTWKYASEFARGATLRVVINPRDVVSVPTDCNDAKLRTCRYRVLDIAEVEVLTPVQETPESWGDSVYVEELDDDFDEDYYPYSNY